MTYGSYDAWKLRTPEDDRPDRCPDCGGSMDWHFDRNGNYQSCDDGSEEEEGNRIHRSDR